jgi:nucleoside-diphosphate-sugar epimerase
MSGSEDGTITSGDEGSGDEDEQSVDSEPEPSSEEEDAVTQTRPAAAPEPPAPMDLSVIRELSERMDASLARLLLRYPPTYSVDPGIDRYERLTNPRRRLK